jgi:hypothetical protein
VKKNSPLFVELMLILFWRTGVVGEGTYCPTSGALVTDVVLKVLEAL